MARLAPISSQEGIKREVWTFYSSLYPPVPETEEAVSARHCLLQQDLPRLSPRQRLLLDEGPSDREFLDTLCLLPAGKSRGLDGMLREILLELWPFVGSLYYAATVQFWESGELPQCFKEGLLFLIPKTLDPDKLSQWRPITLLNITYKVFAKLVAIRLALVLQSIVPPEQQGFIKGRSTQNCVLAFAVMHEALKRDQKSALFFTLDQEKAYDRLLPQFLW
ncbi:hypothetical protein R1sor_008739 [Riccia sorocarpa]|uniref:Reverse transcriptase domain-containing protein n=1 Tax=Riccia sorocarpa TaxID=122646 RepID=A0ABD3HUC7_9MARC